MRICHVTSIHQDFDGRIWKYASSLARSGIKTHLVCPWNVPTETIHEGVIFHTFPRVEKRVDRPIFVPLRLFRRLLPILNEVDVIHFHDFDILPFMAMLSLYKPTIYDVHENYADEMIDRDWIPEVTKKTLSKSVFHFEKIFAKLVRNVVIVAPSQKGNFAIHKVRLLQIANFADDELVKNATPNTYLIRPDKIVFTGSNYESNGSLLLLEIASKLADIRPMVKFLVVDHFGSNKFRDKFMAERSKLGLRERVKIIPKLLPHDIMRLLNQGTIGISPNLRVAKQEKAIPTKLFEYMAAALPIVSSDLPYPKKIFAQNRFGLLAKPETPDTFVHAIIRLVDDRIYAQKLGQSGCKAFLKSYSWESQIPKLLEFYESLA